MESDQTRISFTTMMDEEMCKQAIAVNPFDKTWDDLLLACKQHAQELFKRVKTSKTLRDRLLLLLKKRSEENDKELRASGIEVELTDSQKAVDELIFLKEESERKKEEKKAAKKAVKAAIVVKDAAMRVLVKKNVPGTSQENVAKPQQENQDDASSSNTETTSKVSRKRQNPISALIEYLKERDSANTSLEFQREMHRDRTRLYERELEIRKQELDVRRMEAENQKAFNNQILALLLQKHNQYQ